MKNGAATVGNSLEIHKRLNIELQYDQTILLLGIYTKEMKAYVHTKTCTKLVMAAFIITAQK